MDPSGPSDLPQLSGTVFLTDAGLETDLIFHGGHDLPLFASFVLLDRPDGVAALETYFRDHVVVVVSGNIGPRGDG